eukprot:gene20348-22351_t
MAAEVVESLQELVKNLNETLMKATELRSESEESFFASDYSILVHSIQHYANCYKSLGVNKKNDFDNLIGKHFSLTNIRDAFEELESTQDKWAEFLEENDKIMNKEMQSDLGNVLKEDEIVENGDNKLVNARTGQSKTLREVVKDTNALYTLLDGAKRWLETSGCVFEMYLDDQRKLYKKLSLPKSMKEVWNITTVIHYAEFACQGRQFFRSEDYDDPHQLGGDFLIDTELKLKLIHRSKTPVDRPFIDNLLSATKSS